MNNNDKSSTVVLWVAVTCGVLVLVFLICAFTMWGSPQAVIVDVPAPAEPKPEPAANRVEPTIKGGVSRRRPKAQHEPPVATQFESGGSGYDYWSAGGERGDAKAVIVWHEGRTWNWFGKCTNVFVGLSGDAYGRSPDLVFLDLHTHNKPLLKGKTNEKETYDTCDCWRRNNDVDG